MFQMDETLKHVPIQSLTGQASSQTNQSKASTSQAYEPQLQVLEISDINEQIQKLRHDFNKQIGKLREEVRLLKLFMKKRKESFYQAIVEKHLNGKHKKLASGITDVTNENIHAEIKHWKYFKFALGQLQAYDDSDPKEELHAYFFGVATEEIKQVAFDSCMKRNIKVFTFIESDEKADIIDYATKTVLFTFNIQDDED